jgi:hypothetical protein
MPHPDGAYLGGVRTVADVRLRCVMDAGCDCWHLRSPRGRPMPMDRVHKMWVHGRGSMSATRAVWELAHGRPMPQGRRAVRMCGTYDCANPAHIRALSESQAQRHYTGKGYEMSPARRQHLQKLQRARRRFTPEQVREVRLSALPAAALARQFGFSQSSVAAIRRGETYRDPVASVWELAA